MNMILVAFCVLCLASLVCFGIIAARRISELTFARDSAIAHSNEMHGLLCACEHNAEAAEAELAALKFAQKARSRAGGFARAEKIRAAKAQKEPA